MDREQAERELLAYAAAVARRDELVRAARRAGISKNRIHALTGIARTTIDRIVEESERSMPSQDGRRPA